jgi:hypothetical protein
MGTYSLLLKIINGNCTIIDWKSILPTLDSFKNNNYLDIYEEDCINIKSITDLANYLHDRKLFGYLTNSTKKTLCKISLHTKIIDEKIDIKPKLYFEEEGWDRIHFLEFHPGTETVIWGSYAFDFNQEEIEKSLIDEYKLIYDMEKEDFDYQTRIYDKIYIKKKEYILNLINDTHTNWNIHKLDVNENENKVDFLSLSGIRNEDYIINYISIYENKKILKENLEK